MVYLKQSNTFEVELKDEILHHLLNLPMSKQLKKNIVFRI